jgi:pyruvate formate lyase activating enzyme
VIDLEIKGFIETSFLDWDGKVVSVIYVPYCNFRCPFCHNFGLIKDPQSYESIPSERIKKFLVDRRDFIDGICLTGGEPCLHKGRGLFKFMRRIKDLGFQIKFDTNGTSPELLDKLFNDRLVDYIALDIKGPLDERYDRLSGVKTDLDIIKQSIRIIIEKGVPYEFRTTVVPTLLDTKDIEDIARSVAGAGKFVLQQFTAEHTWDESLREVIPYPREKLEEMVEACKPFVPNTVIRGA